MASIKDNLDASPEKASKNTKIAIVRSLYNPEITGKLLESCICELREAGVTAQNIRTVDVPGAFEIPIACHKLAKTKKYDAIIAIGAVVRGETPHFDFIALGASHGIMEVALQHSIPVVMGLLTTDNLKQAADRIEGGRRGDKGLEAAQTTLKMLKIKY